MQKELLINQEAQNFLFEKSADGGLILDYDGKKYHAKLIERTGDSLTLEVNGKRHVILAAPPYFSVGDRTLNIASARDQRKKKGGAGASDEMSSPMPGKILKLLVEVDQEVTAGQGLVVMEAMKMEHTIKASYDGVVKALHYGEGDLVDGGVDLVELEAKEKEA